MVRAGTPRPCSARLWQSPTSSPGRRNSGFCQCAQVPDRGGRGASRRAPGRVAELESKLTGGDKGLILGENRLIAPAFARRDASAKGFGGSPVSAFAPVTRREFEVQREVLARRGARRRRSPNWKRSWPAATGLISCVSALSRVSGAHRNQQGSRKPHGSGARRISERQWSGVLERRDTLPCCARSA